MFWYDGMVLYSASEGDSCNQSKLNTNKYEKIEGPIFAMQGIQIIIMTSHKS